MNVRIVKYWSDKEAKWIYVLEKKLSLLWWSWWRPIATKIYRTGAEEWSKHYKIELPR